MKKQFIDESLSYEAPKTDFIEIRNEGIFCTSNVGEDPQPGTLGFDE